jgi:integrase
VPKVDFTTADLDALPVGIHSDGTGLEYRVSQRGGRSWFATYKVHGKWTGMGLGPVSGLTLGAAHKEVDRIRRNAAKGLDPKQQRDEAAAATGGAEVRRGLPTVGEFGDIWFGDLKSKNAKVLGKYKREIEVYAQPIRHMRIDQPVTADIFNLLKDRWVKTPVAAREFQRRLRRMFAAAKVLHKINKPNPAAWEDNLEALLSRKRKEKGKPHPSMPYSEIPAFVADLRTKKTIGMKALLFVILTGGRSKETYEAKWHEINLDKAQWLIGGKRMKNGSDAIVPLSKPAVALLRELRAARRPKPDDYIFSVETDGKKPISDATMLRCLQVYMKRPDCTVHGVRATFRTWGQEKTSFDHDTLEHCIHHITGDAQALVYKRGAAVEKRTVIMNAWADYCIPAQSPLHLVA